MRKGLHVNKQTWMWLMLLTLSTTNGWAQVVISQIYGGGGNAGATFKNDYVELFNRGTSPVALTGWSVQYASGTGTTWQPTALTGTIPAGGYYLIQMAAGAGGTVNLPTPDVIGNTNMSGTVGKMALANVTTALTGACPTGTTIVDFVGFGTTANCFEGSGPTPAPSNTTAVLRVGNGCTDTGQNATDFTAGAPNPRNSATIPAPCSGPAGPSVTVTPNPISGLTTTQGTASSAATFTLTASLTTNPITVSASSNSIEVSDNASTGFSSLITLSAATSTTVLYTRLSASAPAGSVGSSFVVSSTGANTVIVPVTGTISSTAVGPIPIATARTLSGQNVTIQGRVTSTVYVGSRVFYMQDATGGIAIYSPTNISDYSTQVQLGDLVTVTGPVSVFSGMTEVTINSFSINASEGRSVPTPILATLDQLANYQGQLVRVENTTIGNTTGGVAATFFNGGTNYNITSGANTGVLRINATSELPGAGKPAGPTSITGIVDRFVSGVTTTGTNGIQLQPRLLTDVQGATTPADQLCGGTGNTSLTPAQTFDVTAWNVEFFGADGGTVSCSASPTSRPYDDLGPFDEARQARNVKTVLDRLNSDVFVLEEVSDATLLSQLVSTSLSGYAMQCADKFSYYWQGDCDQNPVFLPNVLAQKVCVVYKTSTVVPVPSETTSLLAAEYGYGPTGPADANTNAWASGRLPYLFVADATVNGVTRRVHIVGIHAKSGSAAADYARRQQDYIDLKNKLQSQYPSANIMIMGDYNDGALTSITPGNPSSFNTFVTDPTNFSVLTSSLESQGCQTFETGSFLDHITISNELFPAYIANSVNIFTPAVGIEGGYSGNTTSDHRPVSARFDLAQIPASPSSSTALALLTPTYNCATGAITFNTSGGDGTTITYTAVGVQRSSSTSNTGVVEPGLRADAKPLTISATQSGTTVSITFDFAAFCTSPPSSTTSTPGTGQPLALLTPTYNCTTGDITFNTSGGDGTTITYSAVGVQRSSPTSPNGVVEPGLRADAKPLTISATQSGVTVSQIFDFAAFCSSPPSSTTSTPPSNTTGCGSPANTIGQALLVTGVTDLNCQTGTFRILTTGGNGQVISYANNVGLSNDDPTNCVRRLDNPGLIQAINNPGSDVGPFTLKVMQGATQSNTFTFNFKQYCTTPTRVATETLGELAITVLGNPTLGETVEVVVGNPGGEAVMLQVSNAQGQLISRLNIESTNKAIHQRVELGRSTGLYLLQVSTPTRTKTVKVVRQ